jgi:hypothetical protein
MPLHLVRRFLGALDPRGPVAVDERWAMDHLGPGEVALWCRMSGPDRRHAVGVARAVVASLGPSAATRPVVAAALLHDVGKVEAGLGTFGRVPATLAGLAAGHRRSAAWTGTVGTYLRHDSVGADLLRAASADPLTVTWAAEHHLPAARWSLPPAIASALKAADDD